MYGMPARITGMPFRCLKELCADHFDHLEKRLHIDCSSQHYESSFVVLAMKLYHFAERKALRNSPVQQALLEVHNFRARGSGVEACKLAVSEVELFFVRAKRLASTSSTILLPTEWSKSTGWPCQELPKQARHLVCKSVLRLPDSLNSHANSKFLSMCLGFCPEKGKTGQHPISLG